MIVLLLLHKNTPFYSKRIKTVLSTLKSRKTFIDLAYISTFKMTHLLSTNYSLLTSTPLGNNS